MRAVNACAVPLLRYTGTLPPTLTREQANELAPALRIADDECEAFVHELNHGDYPGIAALLVHRPEALGRHVVYVPRYWCVSRQVTEVEIVQHIIRNAREMSTILCVFPGRREASAFLRRFVEWTRVETPHNSERLVLPNHVELYALSIRAPVIRDIAPTHVVGDVDVLCQLPAITFRGS